MARERQSAGTVSCGARIRDVGRLDERVPTFILTDAKLFPRQIAEFLAQRGIPVMGHIGLTPQSINTLGSFRAQGREEGSWEPIENDARAISQAGAFSIVIEAVVRILAQNPAKLHDFG